MGFGKHWLQRLEEWHDATQREVAGAACVVARSKALTQTHSCRLTVDFLLYAPNKRNLHATERSTLAFAQVHRSSIVVLVASL